MKTQRSKFEIVLPSGQSYVGISKLLGKKIVDVFGEPDLYESGFTVHGVLFEDGSFFFIDSSYEGAYIDETLDIELLKSSAEQRELDQYIEDQILDEEEDDEDYEGDEEDEYEEVDRMFPHEMVGRERA